MANASEIRPHMEVVGSDGVHVGTVDHVEGTDRIKLARRDAADGEHHYLPLSAVARVDDKVHLVSTAALALPGVVPVGETAAIDPIVPPVRNRQVEGAPARRNFVLPWLVGLIGLVLLLLLVMRTCVPRTAETTGAVDNNGGPPAAATAPLPVEVVKLPNGQSVNLSANTLNYELQRYLASDQPAPRTFAFDKLNFDTGSATIRAEDQANVDALAQILGAYPQARATVVGYTDTTGSAPANAELGQARAQAVMDALVAKGVDRGKLEAKSGGQDNPTDTNATAGGRFENRRSELTVTAK